MVRSESNAPYLLVINEGKNVKTPRFLKRTSDHNRRVRSPNAPKKMAWTRNGAFKNERTLLTMSQVILI